MTTEIILAGFGGQGILFAWMSAVTCLPERFWHTAA